MSRRLTFSIILFLLAGISCVATSSNTTIYNEVEVAQDETEPQTEEPQVEENDEPPVEETNKFVLSLKQDAEFKYEFTMQEIIKRPMFGQVTTTIQTHILGTKFRVVEPIDDSSYRITMVVEYVASNHSFMDNSHEYDSRNGDDECGHSLPMSAMLEQPVTFCLTRTGEVSEIEGTDDIVDKCIDISEADYEQANMLRETYNERYWLSLISHILPTLSEDDIEEMDSWEISHYYVSLIFPQQVVFVSEETLTLDELDEDGAVIDIEGELEADNDSYSTENLTIETDFEGTLEGELTLSRETGLILSSEKTIEISGIASGQFYGRQFRVDIWGKRTMGLKQRDE